LEKLGQEQREVRSVQHGLFASKSLGGKLVCLFHVTVAGMGMQGWIMRMAPATEGEDAAANTQSSCAFVRQRQQVAACMLQPLVAKNLTPTYDYHGFCCR
jgi:hypothetical protein